MPAGESWLEAGQQQSFCIVLWQPSADVSLEEGRGAAGLSLWQAHCGEPNLYAGKSLWHLSYWFCNTGCGLCADLSLKGCFSCFLAEFSPIFTHQQPSVLPPFQYHLSVCCPGISPTRSRLHGPMKGHHSCFWSPQSRVNTWLREPQGRRGENGLQGF